MNIISYKEMRKLGRDALRGNWGLAIAISILPLLISLFAYSFSKHPLSIQFLILQWARRSADYTSIDYLSILWDLIVSGSLIMGIYLIFIHLARGNTTSLSHLFRYFTDGQLYWKATFLYGLTWIYINCWSLLLFIPGIIKYYAYSMAPYILIDHPELTPNQAITQSRKMMDGHKVELFALHLSFLGWGILCILTLGIGFLWLIPYISATDAQFYRKIRGEMDPIDPTDHPPL